MKTWLNSLEERFDRMAPRERVLVAAGVMTVLCYAYASLFAAPVIAQRNRVATDTAALRSQIGTLDEALAALGRTSGPDAQRAYRDGLRGQIAALDREMRGMQRTLVAPAEMPGLLRSVLARHGHLKLLSLRNAPVEKLQPAAPAQAPASAPGALSSSPGQRAIYRHTVEIRLSGSYAELHAYLAQLERMPWQMYWGRLDVEGKDHPRLVATLTVHTLSLDKAWLEV